MESLKTSLESSERLRKQQKELIHLLQASHAKGDSSEHLAQDPSPPPPDGEPPPHTHSDSTCSLGSTRRLHDTSIHPPSPPGPALGRVAGETPRPPPVPHVMCVGLGWCVQRKRGNPPVRRRPPRPPEGLPRHDCAHDMWSHGSPDSSSPPSPTIPPRTARTVGRTCPPPPCTPLLLICV